MINVYIYKNPYNDISNDFIYNIKIFLPDRQAMSTSFSKSVCNNRMEKNHYLMKTLSNFS